MSETAKLFCLSDSNTDLSGIVASVAVGTVGTGHRELAVGQK